MTGVSPHDATPPRSGWPRVGRARRSRRPRSRRSDHGGDGPCGRAGVRRDARATAPRRAAAHHRWAGRVREGGAAGGARRPRRPGGALGEGPAVGTADGLVIGAFCERRDPADALVGRRLDDLAQARPWPPARCAAGPSWPRCAPTCSSSSCAATSTPGLSKLPDGGAIVMAVAALEILALTDRIAERLDVATFVPAVGQGCVAVECRIDDMDTLAAVAGVDHADTRQRSRSSGRSWPSSARAARSRWVATSAMVASRCSSPTSQRDSRSWPRWRSPGPRTISGSLAVRLSAHSRPSGDGVTG